MTSRHAAGVAALVAAVLGLATVSLPRTSSAGEKKERKRYALLAGTVFTAEGLSLPGVKVTIKRKGDKKPQWKGVSDRRGEFAVRVPSGPATYEVTTHSKERKNQTQTVQIYGEERATVFFRLPLKKSQEEEEE